MFDIGFGSAGDDDFEPRSMCSCVRQNIQEGWATPFITTFIECVNDEDERMLWLTREVANEVKEESALHRLWTQVWIVAKTICYDGSKRGEDSRKFVDEGRKNISVLAQIRVVSPAEKCSSKLLSIMKARTN